MPKSFSVLALLPADLGFGREIARGVRAFAVQQPHWWIRTGPVPPIRGFGHMVDKDRDEGGIIGFLPGEEYEQIAAEQFTTPVINVSGRLPVSRLPRVLIDNQEAGRRAARHLLDRGFTRFAFVGYGRFGYGHDRYQGFVSTLADAGYNCAIAPRYAEPRLAWLMNQPTPLAILASDDREAQRVIDFCRELDLAVPEQVAVVGVDNDLYYCETSQVPLTSVDTRGYEVGYRAAQLLDDLMRGEPAPTEPVIVACGEVVVRRSTDTVAIDDPDLAFAMRHIREHACDPLRVEQIMAHLTIGRRTLEKRFKQAFGRTLHDEIRRVQLERARELLTMTEMRVPDVAHAVGFADDRMFSVVFREAFGQPPGRFRTANRRR